MIDARELRIGNWVNYAGSPYLIEVSDFVGFHKFRSVDPFFTPIPLTPEVLEKCGFVNYGYDLLFWRKEEFPRFEFCGLNSDKGFMFAITFGGIHDLDITSLHSLQNLYFALTGTELDYKP